MAIETHTTFTFEHPELDSMTGIVTPDDVVQFRAVPYASVPARFKQSVILNSLLESNGDYTKHGHACPQTFSADNFGGGAFKNEVFPPPTHESACLILQLNIPLAHLQTKSSTSKLPILVYIHGGGFVLGKIDEQHNTALLVQQSLSTAEPILSLSIQYRVGALGYLHTPSSGNANLALNDQRNALLWVQKFIGGFGGDKQRVTVFGESAGSMSICAHMLRAAPAEGPLFNRAVLMSGSLGPMTTPTRVAEAEEVYRRLLKQLGIEDRGADDVGDALERLSALDVQTIVDASAALSNSGTMWLPVQDSEWFGENAGRVSWDRVPELIGQCEWVDAVVLGTTGFEGATFMAIIAQVKPQEFLESIAEQLGAESAALLSRAYEITPDMDVNLFITRALRWVGDVIFDAPNHALAKYLTTHTNKKVYRYTFNVRNPFPGAPCYQVAHHWVDVYFVFKTFQFRYPTQRLKDLSSQHAQLWVDFTNGKAPWSEYKDIGNGNEIVIVADEHEGWVERTVRQDEEITELSWTRCELLWESWETKRGAAFYPMKIACLDGKKLV